MAADGRSIAMVPAEWAALLFDPRLLPLSFVLTSVTVAIALVIAACFLEHVRRIGCQHTLERSSGSNVFFEDPNSLKKVPCPSILDPPEKYIYLIIPAFNEEHRLPRNLVETIKY